MGRQGREGRGGGEEAVAACLGTCLQQQVVGLGDVHVLLLDALGPAGLLEHLLQRPRPVDHLEAARLVEAQLRHEQRRHCTAVGGEGGRVSTQSRRPSAASTHRLGFERQLGVLVAIRPSGLPPSETACAEGRAGHSGRGHRSERWASGSRAASAPSSLVKPVISVHGLEACTLRKW